MRNKGGWLSGIVMMVVLGFAFATASSAQTTTKSVELRTFEVILVDGNQLYYRDPNGTNVITVPDDFRFTIDGKKMAVSELKPGMKGSATVTTTTTVKPVFVTEVREAEVLRASDMSMSVRQADGTARRWTQGQLEAKGIQIYKDGKPVRIADLKKGDKLTAMIITTAAPVVMTEQEVQATLAEPAAAPAPAPMAAAPAAAPATPPAAAPAATPAPAPEAAPPTKMASADTPAPSAAPAPTPPPESSGIPTWFWLLVVLIAIVLFFVLRRKKQA